MLAPAESAPNRPSPPPLPSALLAAELGPVVMADGPCEAASADADPTGPRKYYRARYYDPKIGRFISEDPIGLRGGVNVYPYAGANPVRHVDPYGKDWKSFTKGVGLGAAAVGVTALALAQAGIDVPNDVAAIATIVAAASYIKGQLDPSMDQDMKDQMAGELVGGVVGIGIANGLASDPAMACSLDRTPTLPPLGPGEAADLRLYSQIWDAAMPPGGTGEFGPISTTRAATEANTDAFIEHIDDLFFQRTGRTPPSGWHKDR